MRPHRTVLWGRIRLPGEAGTVTGSGGHGGGVSLLGLTRRALSHQHRRTLPPPRVPMCPGCGADVRASAMVLVDALDAVGARGRTYWCRCGERSRWELDAPLPILLASETVSRGPRSHAARGCGAP
jgi:hypothetical protein